MVGRTPEYLGKKIEAYEMKMASLVILIPPAVVLIGTADRACVTAAARRASLNPGAHGFSEVLYAFSSAGNNNGSAFAGLRPTSRSTTRRSGWRCCSAATGWWFRSLAIAGSLAAQEDRPVGPGTLPTHTPLFVVLLVGVVRPRRRPDVRAGAGAGSDRRASHARRREVRSLTPMASAWSRPRSLFDPPIVKRAIVDSFRKLTPSARCATR